MPDGKIVFSTALDNKELEKELARTKRDIEKQEIKVSELDAKKSPLVQQAQEIERAMKGARAEVARYRAEWVAGGPGAAGADRNHTAAIVRAQQLEAEHAKVEEQIDKIDAKLLPACETLDDMKEKAGGLEQELAASERGASRMGEALSAAERHMEKFTQRVKGLARRVLIFSVITMALRSLRTWMGKVIQANTEASSAVARLKGALLTLAQPLVQVVIPAFTTLVNVLAQLVTLAAQALSSLFGTTAEKSAQAAQSLYEETEALEGVSGAAKRSGRAMASFDEINTLSTDSGGGSGGASGGEIKPDFTLFDQVSERLEDIARKVALIGAGFGLWKLGSALPGVLGAIATTLGLILITVGGLCLAWDGLTDAWENGVDWTNLAEMVGGLAAACFGLYGLFGPMAAGIALVVGGIAMLVTGFRDAMTNGWNLQNLLLSVAGIFATGLGISLLTGSLLPALIGAIGGVLLAITVATGHGEELIAGIRQILQGFVDFFTGIFTGDIEKAVGGIETIFDGLKAALGAVIDGIRDFFLGFLDWLDEKTGGRLHGIIETAKGFVTAFFDTLKSTVGNAIEGVKQIFTGLTKFLTGVFTADFDLAWEGIKDIFKGTWNTIVSLLEGAINLIIQGLNWLISKMNKISFSVPEWVPSIGGKKFGIDIPNLSKVTIPRLAQGAVIPPNREFMAVLGDQHSGTNIETPLETMVQAFRQAMSESGGGGSRDVTVVLQLDRREFARAVYHANNDETQRVGVRLVGGV